ncbi:hypothetical protein [Streptomyces sp. NPDC002602]|uniref:hypothetical protein n=1 Tax=Streptomyces sp. NPDC002602 TaxID=3364654 RepID=UPI0036873993
MAGRAERPGRGRRVASVLARAALLRAALLRAALLRAALLGPPTPGSLGRAAPLSAGPPRPGQAAPRPSSPAVA